MCSLKCITPSQDTLKRLHCVCMCVTCIYVLSSVSRVCVCVGVCVHFAAYVRADVTDYTLPRNVVLCRPETKVTSSTRGRNLIAYCQTEHKLAGFHFSPFTTSELSYSRAEFKGHLYFTYQTVKLILGKRLP